MNAQKHVTAALKMKSVVKKVNPVQYFVSNTFFSTIIKMFVCTLNQHREKNTHNGSFDLALGFIDTSNFHFQRLAFEKHLWT